MTGDSELFLIDSNLLVYASEKEENSNVNKAKEMIKKCWDGKELFAVSSQNLGEFVYVTTRKGKLSLEEARVFTSFIVDFNGFKKIEYNANTILSAIDIAKEFKTPFWDSLLAATMRENGIFNIYTENVNDFKMPWIKAVNPLK